MAEVVLAVARRLVVVVTMFIAGSVAVGFGALGDVPAHWPVDFFNFAHREKGWCCRGIKNLWPPG